MLFAGAGFFDTSTSDGFFEADASLKTKHNNPKVWDFWKCLRGSCFEGKKTTGNRDIAKRFKYEKKPIRLFNITFGIEPIWL